MNQAAENFEKIVQKIPDLSSVLSKINEAGIQYGLYAGAHVSILTSNRVPDDVDFLVSNRDTRKLKSLFPVAKVKHRDDGVFVYIGANNAIELTSCTDVRIGNAQYDFRLTDLCWKHTNVLRGNGFAVRLLNIADTLLLKAMFQRGSDKNKHDLEDIEALLTHCEIDKKYLSERLLEVGADERLIGALKKCNLV